MRPRRHIALRKHLARFGAVVAQWADDKTPSGSRDAAYSVQLMLVLPTLFSDLLMYKGISRGFGWTPFRSF